MLGLSDLSLLLLIFTPLLLRDRKGFLALFLSGLVVEVMKFAFAIPRPIPAEGFGYPSGHTVISVLFFLIYRERFGPLLSLIPGVFTLSRVYFSFHSIKQVVCSFGLAYLLYAFFYHRSFKGSRDLARKVAHLGLGFLLLGFFLLRFYWTLYVILLLILALYNLKTPFAVKGEDITAVLRHWASLLFISYFFDFPSLLYIAVPLYVGDAFAAIFGKPGGKSLTGSLGVFVSSLVFYPFLGLTVIPYALLMTLVEFYAPDDNLFLPLAGGLFLWFLKT
jgi:dolichol kinase